MYIHTHIYIKAEVLPYELLSSITSIVASAIRISTIQIFLYDSLDLQNLLIFENLIDLKRCYTFPIEIEVSEIFQWC